MAEQLTLENIPVNTPDPTKKAPGLTIGTVIQSAVFAHCTCTSFQKQEFAVDTSMQSHVYSSDDQDFGEAHFVIESMQSACIGDCGKQANKQLKVTARRLIDNITYDPTSEQITFLCEGFGAARVYLHQINIIGQMKLIFTW
ncbi:MAG: hypothetical protein PHT88_03745 [Candidatus Moranbacteria bacterium]|nr:hypothetical protein [Candidatus Moranbacteria bacterium]